MLNPEYSKPPVHIEEKQREEIMNGVGTIADAFEIIDGMPVMLITKATKKWESRRKFDLQNGVIDDETLLLIDELKKDGDDVMIGLPHDENNEYNNARLILRK